LRKVTGRAGKKLFYEKEAIATLTGHRELVGRPNGNDTYLGHGEHGDGNTAYWTQKKCGGGEKQQLGFLVRVNNKGV